MILFQNFIYNYPFLYYNIQVALLVSSSFPLFIMLLELMFRWLTLWRSLFSDYIFLLTWYSLLKYKKCCIIFKKNLYGFINIYIYIFKYLLHEYKIICEAVESNKISIILLSIVSILRRKNFTINTKDIWIIC